MRTISALILTLVLLASCKDRIICPAFQSTYILDDSTRMFYYSYLWNLDEPTRNEYIASMVQGQTVEDSLATDTVALAVGGTSSDVETYFSYVSQYIQPVKDVRRSKFGIIKYEPMWLKNYNLKTAPMENVPGPEEEKPEVEEPVDIGEFVASDFSSDSTLTVDSLGVVQLDSISSDSAAVIPSSLVATADVAEEPKGPRYLYRYDPSGPNNVEQEYYNKYFGEFLVYKPPKKKEDVEEIKTDTLNAATDSLSMATDSLGVGAFQETDSLQTTPIQEEGGLFRNKKKKKRRRGEATDEGNDPNDEGRLEDD